MSKSQGNLYKTTVEVEYKGKKVRVTKKDAATLKRIIANENKTPAKKQ